MQWRQSANDRCSGSEQADCAVEHSLPHAICFYPSTGHTCQRRSGSIETLLSSVSWLCPPLCLFNVQSGAWHWSLLTARPASVQCMGGKLPILGAKRLNTPLLLLLCFSCEHGGGYQGQRMQSVSFRDMREIFQILMKRCLMMRNIFLQTFKSALSLDMWIQFLSHHFTHPPPPSYCLAQSVLICMCSPVWILKAYTGQDCWRAVRWLLFNTNAASPVSLALFLEKDFSFSWIVNDLLWMAECRKNSFLKKEDAVFELVFWKCGGSLRCIISYHRRLTVKK